MTVGEMITKLEKYPTDMKVMMEYNDLDKMEHPDLLEVDDLEHEKLSNCEYILVLPKFLCE